MAVTDAALSPPLAGPSPPEKPLSFLKFLRTAPDNFIAALPRAVYEDPVWVLPYGSQQTFLVSDPASVKQVLLDNVANYPKAPEEIMVLGAAFGDGLLVSQGEKWRAHRRIMSPSFDHKSIVSYVPGMTETISTWLKGWDGRAAGSSVDIANEMTQLTLKVISRAMFSSDADGISDLMGDTLRRGMESMNFGVLEGLPLIGPILIKRKMDNIHRIFSALDGAIYGLIDARAKAPRSGSPDLLDRLIAARDDETGGKMSNQEVRDETVIIFIAGHETTAVAMTFVWYLLSQHPKEEAKLWAELDSVLGGRLPAYDDLAKLPYTRMVIEEAMRLYPPAPGISNRRAQGEDVLCGHRIKPQANILIAPWVLHRHAALWNDPLRFDPERFSPERSAGRHRFAYLPFGGGPRICIGAALAMTEASLILATIAQRYRVRLAPGEKIELRNRITLRPKDGLRMILERR
jgi:cytochrome P450